MQVIKSLTIYFNIPFIIICIPQVAFILLNNFEKIGSINFSSNLENDLKSGDKYEYLNNYCFPYRCNKTSFPGFRKSTRV